MNKPAIALFLAFQTAVCLAQTPDLGDARVTLPFKELKSLLEAAHPDKASPGSKPPVASALLSARCRMALLEGRAEGEVEIEAQSFSNEWTSIPLIGAAAQIERTEPADARVILHDDRYVLVTNHEGITKITLHFACPVSTGKDGQEFEIPLASAAIRTLILTGIPGDNTIAAGKATLISAGKGTAEYRLPNDRESAVVKIHPRPEPVTPSRWRIETGALVRYAEGKLSYRARVAAYAADGSGLFMDLLLPPGARVIEVKGDDLSTWSAGKSVRVTWKTRNLLTREIELLYEMPQPATAGDWKLAAPALMEGEPPETIFAVAGEPGMEIVAPGRAPGRLPRWLAQEAGRRNAVIAGTDGVIAVKWLPLVPTTPAVIESAQSAMRVVPDGSLINEMSYSIRHEGPLTWRLQLPEGSQLLACSVNSQRVNPVDRGQGLIELAMDAPEQKPVTVVKISCTAKKEAFKPVAGRIDLELPRTDLLIQKIDWDLQIPGGYELAALEGNVETSVSGRPGLIQLHKELCKNEQPGVRLYYQKPETKK